MGGLLCSSHQKVRMLALRCTTADLFLFMSVPLFLKVSSFRNPAPSKSFRNMTPLFQGRVRPRWQYRTISIRCDSAAFTMIFSKLSDPIVSSRCSPAEDGGKPLRLHQFLQFLVLDPRNDCNSSIGSKSTWSATSGLTL